MLDKEFVARQVIGQRGTDPTIIMLNGSEIKLNLNNLFL